MTAPITDAEVAEIERLAEAATDGPWELYAADLVVGCPTANDEGNIVCQAPDMPASMRHWPDNAAYIAALNPPVLRALIARLRAAERAREAEGWRPTHRHKKRGTEYELVGVATLQATLPPSDETAMQVYRGHDGRLWVRPLYEFNDGRFEPLPAPPAPRAEVGE